MWGEFLVLEQSQKSVAELVWLDGGDTDAEVAVDSQDVLRKLLETSAFVLIASHIHARQHDFLEAVGDDLANVVIDVFSWTAGGSASDHGDNAIGTEVVAAVMDLDEATGVEGVEGRLIAEEVAVVALGVAASRAEVLVDDVEKGCFALVVNDIIHDARLHKLVLSVIYHAACDGDECFRVLPPDLVDGLAAFLVARIGDGAGVHDEDIGIAIAVGNLVSRRLESRRQSISLIQIDAAA